ncbi:sugar diacid recognition domain-containing protein [Cedecea neteri]|uniref:sugar diacid recognition domain-containing protein n=1 Tax=Cedecea neteri TaxID=158822 RepID=UPI002899E8AC|nr:sugar diacid recognition domain-containing protein [Cedecea neteri]
MMTSCLKEDTARQIVQRTMNIIDYSVNVMSEQGVIIASGDPRRLHQRHEGAVLALTENRTVIIDEASARRLKGVKPGINLPIVFRQRIVGVVGISGEPEKVQAYAELVKMAAELILEQAEMLEQNQWEKRYREQLAAQIISGQQSLAELRPMASGLGVDLDLSRVALMIHFPSREVLRQRELLERLGSYDSQALVTPFGFEQIAMLLPLGGGRAEERLALLKKTLRKLHSQLLVHFDVTLSVGGFFEGDDALRRSWLSAVALHEMASRQKIGRSILYYQDLLLPVLLNGLSGSWQADEMGRAWKTLCEADTKGVLRRTLRCYFEQNCDLSLTTKLLHIHVNTLRYRLSKIESITALDINNLGSILQLFIGMQLSD